jgi:transcription elongation factor GreA
MLKKPSYLTKEGDAKLRAELEHLTGPVRLELAKKLRAAIQMGDLSENADYHAAKEEQGFVEGRIAELNAILREVVIIEETSTKKTAVDVGCVVTIEADSGQTTKYYIVGPQEADPMNGRISDSSPIGSALIGHKVNEVVTATTPGGERKYRIISIE